MFSAGRKVYGALSKKYGMAALSSELRQLLGRGAGDVRDKGEEAEAELLIRTLAGILTAEKDLLSNLLKVHPWKPGRVLQALQPPSAPAYLRAFVQWVPEDAAA